MNSIKIKIGEFLNGGDSPTSRYGQVVGTILLTSLKWLAITMFALVFVVIGQFSQLMTSSNDVRTHAISSWVYNNPSQKTIADQFVDVCLIGKEIEGRQMESKIVGVYECGISMGADSLVNAVKEGDSSLVSYSWPLSIFDTDKH